MVSPRLTPHQIPACSWCIGALEPHHIRSQPLVGASVYPHTHNPSSLLENRCTALRHTRSTPIWASGHLGLHPTPVYPKPIPGLVWYGISNRIPYPDSQTEIFENPNFMTNPKLNFRESRNSFRISGQIGITKSRKRLNKNPFKRAIPKLKKL